MMVNVSYSKVMGGYVLVKSLLIGITAAIIDVTFVRAMILVVVSAIVTGMFGIVVAKIQIKGDAQIHERLDRIEMRGNDVAGALGADRRTNDPNAGSSTSYR